MSDLGLQWSPVEAACFAFIKETKIEPPGDTKKEN